jgi:predicted kinase
MADLLGSVQLNGGTMIQDIAKMELIKDCAKALNIWHSVDVKQMKKLVKFGNNRNILPWKTNYDENKVAYIMIGLPGAGKNTVIDNGGIIPTNHVHISRDDIRIQLGYCKPGEKYLGTTEEENEVTRVYNEQFQNAIDNGNIIVLNNVHLKKKYRDESVSILRANGYKIVYVYVEAPTLDFNYKRRDGQIAKDRIKEMALSFEWPEATEYDELIISKQTY